jgi:hypothetical protein
LRRETIGPGAGTPNIPTPGRAEMRAGRFRAVTLNGLGEGYPEFGLLQPGSRP